MKLSLPPFLQEWINSPRQHVIFFMVGASIFFVGLGMVLVAGQFMPEGEMAEWVALLGLAVLAVGALVASVFYIGLLLNRLWKVFYRD